MLSHAISQAWHAMPMRAAQRDYTHGKTRMQHARNKGKSRHTACILTGGLTSSGFCGRHPIRTSHGSAFATCSARKVARKVARCSHAHAQKNACMHRLTQPTPTVSPPCNPGGTPPGLIPNHHGSGGLAWVGRNLRVPAEGGGQKRGGGRGPPRLFPTHPFLPFATPQEMGGWRQCI